MTKDEIIARLKEGNKKYLTAKTNDGDISEAIRVDTTDNGQHPYAVVVACSDSRVVPEDIFMTGIGELFVIRVAGNVITETQLGSIEYACGHLGSPVVVVLGHTNCGAVGAALEGDGEEHVKSLTDYIHIAIGNEKDYEKACCLNAEAGAKIVKDALGTGDNAPLAVAAMYDIKTGEVSWL
ncbi:MAG: carbonic anhydrase [Lachnospiraceae bacterium]|nr:carbonic anhydrase [Lachnospiraceae bacterium]